MQMRNTSKTYAVLSAALFLAGVISTGSHAFTSQGASTQTASATLIGDGVVSMNVAIRRMSDNVAAGNIPWTGVTLPSGWRNADHYILLHSTITDATGGIRIVTNNKGDGADPAYTGSNTTAGGLVDNTNHGSALQLAWTIKDGVVGSTGPVSAKPYEVADGTGQVDQFQWLYMTDQVDTTLAQGAAYRTAVNTAGIHFGGGNTEFGAAASPNIVYLEADFNNALTPRTYSTNRLIVEAYTE